MSVVALTWDTDEIDRRLTSLVTNAPLSPLTEKIHTIGPGAYLLFYRGDNPLYSGLTTVRWPIYVGRALNPPRRMSEHRCSISSVSGLAVDAFEVLVAATSAPASAGFLEERLMALYRPVWNESWLAGFGSKHQGLARIANQQPTLWDRLHHGRSWAHVAAASDPVLRRRVRAHLLATIKAAKVAGSRECGAHADSMTGAGRAKW